MSRTLARQWIESGAVTVNGAAILRASARVAEGARIVIAPPSSTAFRARPSAEPLPIDIVCDDAAFLVVNKPAGIAVHPSYKQASGTLLHGVLWHVRDRAGVQPGIVTRLDKDTTGLVLVALDAATHRLFARDALEGRLGKRYLAIVSGWPRPRQGSLSAPIARDPADRRRMIVASDGAPSLTRYAVVSHGETGGRREALVACELATGRTHQIRVHLAAAGWPIVGDRTYGTPDSRIARQALHASRLSLRHPRTREVLELEAPLPRDMEGLVSAFKPDVHPR